MRERAGLSVAELALLLRVVPSSVYRWEQAGTFPDVGTMPAMLLSILATTSPARVVAVRRHLQTRGTLVALAVLLRPFVPKDAAALNGWKTRKRNERARARRGLS